MARIMAIDVGAKRIGLAVTDSLQIIASALETVSAERIFDYLKKYFEQEPVETLVVGYPKGLDGKPTDGTKYVEEFVNKLQTIYPNLKIVLHDERFTSKMAMQTLVASGVKKKDRQVKANLDKVSATIILQSYMTSKI